MKKYVLILMILSFIGILTTYANETSMIDSKINYNETIEAISNPERGFYIPIEMVCKEEGNKAKNPKTDSKNNITITQISFDIGAFGKTKDNPNGKDFTKNMLDSLDKTAENARKNGVMLIVRFAYSYTGEMEEDEETYISYEPSMEQIVKHISQLEPFFKKNEDVIMCVQSGFLGPWGEQHGTELAENLDNYKRVIDELLKVVPESRTISVRYPEIFSNYIGIDLKKDLPRYISSLGTNAYRIGIYNDGYLGSVSDYGTFRYSDDSNNGKRTAREEQISWIKNQAKHTYYGGETSLDDDSEDTRILDENGLEYYDIKRVSKEIYDTHTSYLNIEYDRRMIDKWLSDTYEGIVDEGYKGKSSYTYIENHLGYRFVIRESKLTSKVLRGEEFLLQAKIENVGAGNIVNEKETKLLFVKDGEIKHTENTNLDIRNWTSRPNFDEKTIHDVDLNVTVPSEIEAGSYLVYIKSNVPNDEHINKSIRFANEGVWDEKIGANYMGTFEIIEKTNNENVNGKDYLNKLIYASIGASILVVIIVCVYLKKRLTKDHL